MHVLQDVPAVRDFCGGFGLTFAQFSAWIDAHRPSAPPPAAAAAVETKLPAKPATGCNLEALRTFCEKHNWEIVCVTPSVSFFLSHLSEQSDSMMADFGKEHGMSPEFFRLFLLERFLQTRSQAAAPAVVIAKRRAEEVQPAADEESVHRSKRPSLEPPAAAGV